MIADIGQAQGTDFYSLGDLLSEEERAVRDRVRAWCDKEVLPVVNDYWSRGEFPRELLQGFADLGIAGSHIRGHGCPGLSAVADGMVSAELARGDGSLSTFHAVHTGLAMTAIDMLGSEEQKARYLPPMARLEHLGAFALTEPDHGSDVVALETRARRDGSDYVLEGRKRWIGNGTLADTVVVWARDDDGKVGGFLVDRSQGEVPGYEAHALTNKTANRALWQAEITLSGVRVPAGARLEHSRSFADTSRVLAVSRQTVAWEGLGHAVAAYECAVAYAGQRQQFGKPIASFQLVQDKLSHMLSDITAMQTLCFRLAQLQDEGRVTLGLASLAKLNTAAGARRVCSAARDILGGNGILLDYHVARHHADVEAVYTYEGTDSIQSLIVGREITGLSAFA